MLWNLTIDNKIKELRRRELVFMEQDNNLMTAVVRAQIECLEEVKNDANAMPVEKEVTKG